MKKINKIKISKNSTIREALKAISQDSLRIAVVVDKKDKLVGTLTDGDIRRGLLKGLSMESSVDSIVSKNPVVVKKKDSEKDILKIAIAKKIYQIPVINNSGKIVGIYTLDEFIVPKKKLNKIIIMAGGKGTRLRPLTKNVPKPMLKIGNKPILLTIVEKFKESGYKNFIMCVNYKSKIIEDYFGDGKKFGVKIEYIREKKRMGTAGALSLFKKKPKEPIFVINGDLLTTLDFEKLLDFHNENNSDATMCIQEYNIKSPYGEIKLNKEKIISIREKPTYKILVNAGLYVLNPKCIDLIPKKFYDMTLLFNNMISKKYKITSFPIGEYWTDIGQINDYKKANNEYERIFKI
jgi:dTDP-glucose pyrophosphorylase/predicted transcriptional regulator